jgi:hypothetical protein
MADRMIIDCIIFLIARSMIGLRVQASQQPPPGILLLDVLVLRDDRQWRVPALQQQPSRSGSQHHSLSNFGLVGSRMCTSDISHPGSDLSDSFLFFNVFIMFFVYYMAHECVFCYPQKNLRRSVGTDHDDTDDIGLLPLWQRWLVVLFVHELPPFCCCWCCCLS